MIHTIAGTRLDHGGPSRSVPALCDSLSERDVNVQFVTGCPADPAIGFHLPKPTITSHLIKESSRFGRLSVGRKFRHTLRAVFEDNLGSNNGSSKECLIHDHGVWLSSNHAVAAYARQQNVIRIVSPRGMLSSWAIDSRRWKKRLAWWAYQRSDLLSADAFHVTARIEADEVRALGFTQPIAIIPNGIALNDGPVGRTREGGRKRMLFLSRIHPKKGVIELIHAWKRAAVNSDWELIIAGTNEGGHQQQVESEVRKLELTDFVKFPGPIADADKWKLYAEADLFVLPSFSENFGIVVAEALAAGLPVITTTGTPWEELKQRCCGWWVQPTVEELSNAIVTATRLSTSERQAMGQAGSAWVRSDFTWDAVAQQMVEFYAWLLKRGHRPGCVDTVE